MRSIQRVLLDTKQFYHVCLAYLLAVRSWCTLILASTRDASLPTLLKSPYPKLAIYDTLGMDFTKKYNGCEWVPFLHLIFYQSQRSFETPNRVHEIQAIHIVQVIGITCRFYIGYPYVLVRGTNLAMKMSRRWPCRKLGSMNELMVVVYLWGLWRGHRGLKIRGCFATSMMLYMQML